MRLLVGLLLLFVGCCCCWTATASTDNFRDILSLSRVPSLRSGNRERRVNNLEIARLIRMIATLNQDAKPTVPLDNDQIDQILAQIPQVANDSICLQSESCAQSWIDYYNYALGKIYEKAAVLEYQFETNITEENGKLNEEFAPISNKFLALTKFTSAEFLKNSQSWDPVLRRMLYLASLGIVLKDDSDAKLLSSLTNELGSIYAAARVCEESSSTSNNSTECMSLDPELTELMKSSRDYDRLLWAWKGWHQVTGPKMKAPYARAVEIQNRGAVYSNYQDLSERWIEDYEDSDFEQIMDDLFAQIKPLYQQLHAYTRRKLRQLYGHKYPTTSHNPKLIPAHLLGNMWAQSWENIFDVVQPYPDAPQVNLTKVLIERGYTPVKIFEESELFFTSMGLYPMTPTFWKYSMLVKPSGSREVQCHASAIDFGNEYDFRIKMCTSVNEENFYVVHHEMGHIEYFMAYSKQPTVFKNGANSAFHEAIGDTIALSVMTTKHFKTIGVLESDEMSPEQEINFLMQMALKKLVFMPFGYLMDKWRWDVFRGKINESNYNQRWWEMIKEFQGLEAPIERSEADFDPGAKYHIASFVPYSRYFISHFLQFHFYKALCDHAGHQGPYHKCDFYDSKTAGFYLKKTLEMGNSKHWSIALKTLTGESKMSAKPVLDYFKPLADWLQKENSKYPDDLPGFD